MELFQGVAEIEVMSPCSEGIELCGCHRTEGIYHHGGGLGTT